MTVAAQEHNMTLISYIITRRHTIQSNIKTSSKAGNKGNLIIPPGKMNCMQIFIPRLKVLTLSQTLLFKASRYLKGAIPLYQRDDLITIATSCYQTDHLISCMPKLPNVLLGVLTTEPISVLQCFIRRIETCAPSRVPIVLETVY